MESKQASKHEGDFLVEGNLYPSISFIEKRRDITI
jgi:hypothetical protein